MSARHCPLLAYFPVPHGEQTRSDVAFGVTLSVSPALQLDHAPHVVTFSMLLKVLAGHALHWRFVVAVGTTLTNVPAPHADSGLHSRLVVAVGAVFSYSEAPHSTSFAIR